MGAINTGDGVLRSISLWAWPRHALAHIIFGVRHLPSPGPRLDFRPCTISLESVSGLQAIEAWWEVRSSAL